MFLFLVSTMICAPQYEQFSADRELPLLATVHNKTLHVPGPEGGELLDAIPIDNPPKLRMKFHCIPFTTGTDPRYSHQFKYESLWLTENWYYVWRMKFSDFDLFEGNAQVKFNPFGAEGAERGLRYRKRYPKAKVGYEAHQIALPTMREKYKASYDKSGGRESTLGGTDRAKNVVTYGSVPTSDTSLKCYMLIKPNRYVEIWDTQFRWNEEIQEWKTIADGKNPEEIECPFSEPFYFFIRKNDYYFVTQSGELYIAPPSKKGEKSRTMAALWDDKTRPIVGIIEDADNDKVWLFAQNKKDAKLGYYFEMLPRTSFETFDPTKLTPVNAGGRAKRLLEYLPLIRAEGKKGRGKGS